MYADAYVITSFVWFTLIRILSRLCRGPMTRDSCRRCRVVIFYYGVALLFVSAFCVFPFRFAHRE